MAEYSGLWLIQGNVRKCWHRKFPLPEAACTAAYVGEQAFNDINRLADSNMHVKILDITWSAS